MSEDVSEVSPPTPATISALYRYFLYIGAVGFGGPIALISYVHRDLVERKKLLSRDEFVEGLALAQLAPGSIAAQLAMYVGWLRRGFRGAAELGAIFLLPSVVLVIVLAALYSHFGNLPAEHRVFTGIFYGIGAAVIAVIAVGTRKMARLTLKHEPLLWSIFGASLLLSIFTAFPPFFIFVTAGIIAAVLRRQIVQAPLASIIFPLLQLSTSGETTSLLLRMFVYFFCAGSIAFGGGLVIVPYLHHSVVEQYHWVSERQFLDAVAISIITPGPAIIAVTFIGYLVAGVAGALVSTVAVFLPSLLIVVVAANYYRRAQNNPALKSFIEGVTAAAIGAMASTVWTLGTHAITDLPTLFIAAVSLCLLIVFKRLPEPLVLLGAALVGVACQYLPV